MGVRNGTPAPEPAESVPVSEFVEPVELLMFRLHWDGARQCLLEAAESAAREGNRERQEVCLLVRYQMACVAASLLGPACKLEDLRRLRRLYLDQGKTEAAAEFDQVVKEIQGR